MKHLLSIGLIILSLNAVSQVQPVTNTKQPVFFIDSVQVSQLGLNLVNPINIESITILKKDKQMDGGAIYITLKRSAKMFTIKDILKANDIAPAGISLFILNNEIIKDTSGFKIDSSILLKVETVKSSEIKYLPPNISGFTILELFTQPGEGTNKKNTINIRGNSIDM